MTGLPGWTGLNRCLPCRASGSPPATSLTDEGNSRLGAPVASRAAVPLIRWPGDTLPEREAVLCSILSNPGHPVLLVAVAVMPPILAILSCCSMGGRATTRLSRQHQRAALGAMTDGSATRPRSSSRRTGWFLSTWPPATRSGAERPAMTSRSGSDARMPSTVFQPAAPSLPTTGARPTARARAARRRRSRGPRSLLCERPGADGGRFRGEFPHPEDAGYRGGRHE